MKALLLILSLCFCGAFTQINAQASDTIYNSADLDSIPAFQGGPEALYMYLADSVVYPVAAMQKGIQGDVIMKFLIKENGKVSLVEVLQGEGLLAEEATRVVGNMPDWIPGYKNGKAVSTFFELPIKFKLN